MRVIKAYILLHILLQKNPDFSISFKFRALIHSFTGSAFVHFISLGLSELSTRHFVFRWNYQCSQYSEEGRNNKIYLWVGTQIIVFSPFCVHTLKVTSILTYSDFLQRFAVFQDDGAGSVIIWGLPSHGAFCVIHPIFSVVISDISFMIPRPQKHTVDLQ